MHVLGVCFNIPILSTSVYKPYTSAGTSGRQSYKINVAVIRKSSIHPDLVGPHDFNDSCPFTFQLSCRIQLVEYIPPAFLSPFCSNIVLVPLWQVHIYRYNKLFLSFDNLNVRWLMVSNYVCCRTLSKHVTNKKFQIFC